MKLTILAWYVSGWWELIETENTTFPESSTTNTNYIDFYERIRNKNEGFGFDKNSSEAFSTYFTINNSSIQTMIELGETFDVACYYKIFEYQNDIFFIVTFSERYNNDYKRSTGLYQQISGINVRQILYEGPSYNDDWSYNDFPSVQTSDIHCWESNNRLNAVFLSNENLFIGYFEKNDNNYEFIQKSYAIVVNYPDNLTAFQLASNDYSATITISNNRIVSLQQWDPNSLKFIKQTNLQTNSSDFDWWYLMDIRIQKVNDYQNDSCTIAIFNTVAFQGSISIFNFPNGLYDSNYNWKEYQKDSFGSFSQNECRNFYMNNSATKIIVFGTTSSNIINYNWDQVRYYQKNLSGEWNQVTNDSILYSDNSGIKNILTSIGNIVFPDSDSGFYTYSYQKNNTLYSYDLVWND